MRVAGRDDHRPSAPPPPRRRSATPRARWPSSGISGMPVLSHDGNVIGVISEADVLAKARRSRRRTGGRSPGCCVHGRPQEPSSTTPASSVRP